MILAEGHQITETKLDVRVQTGSAELVEQIAGEWRRLCDESGDEEVFYRPEWAQAYLQAFDSQASVTIITAWEGERLRGVLPLVWRRIIGSGLPITRLTLPSNLHSLRASLTVCPGQEGEAALRLLWQATRNLPKWDVLDVTNVVDGNGLDRLSRLANADGYPTARKRTSQTLYLPIGPSSFDPKAQPPWLAETRPKFRSHLRRTRKQLEEQGTLEFKHVHTADPIALEKFYELEASGWKGAEGTAIKCDPRTRQFYDLVAQAAARDGYLSLDFLQLNGKAIAGHFGFNLQGRYFLAKAGYDESFRRQGPGQLLVNEVLSKTPQLGLHEFDFVGPATWDESRWASARRSNYRIFIFNRTWYGRLLRFLRISVREKVLAMMGRLEDESAPLELKSKPQGSDKDPRADS
ncbi:MAG: GNAT family N-acetyltransferase [Acidobacteriia bacterium]|nr:GNAT family N-acetyltransferase [Terriglobia bacterium]